MRTRPHGVGDCEKQTLPDRPQKINKGGRRPTMTATKNRTGRLTWRELALVAVVGALPVAILGPALLIMAQG